MRFTILFAMLFLAALFIAGCQEEPVQPPVTSASVDDAAAIAMIEAEIAAVSHPGWKIGNRNFIGILSGREEIPPTNSRGRGVAKFQVSKDGKSISYRLIVANTSNVVGAHVHLGPAGENGAVVFGLYSGTAGGGRIRGPIAQGSFTPADLAGPYAGSEDFSLFLSDLHADSLYVNVHTSDGIDSTTAGRGDYNDGEIRGQLKGHRPKGEHTGHDGERDDDDRDGHDG
ncbi:MAG TPA: CHRD domain-containing protein [Bacteroidota bacterium]|nr:CHRD domain-containing protein [Bacteroidota bacterium]